MEYKVISSLKSVSGVRFSVSRNIFRGAAGFDDMEDERYVAVMNRWVVRKDCKVSITWEIDELNDVYTLHELCAAGHKFRLEPHKNGTGVPKLTGRALAEERVREQATRREADGEPEAESQFVDVPWVHGGRPLVQRWRVCEPEDITEDVRDAGEWQAKLKQVLPNPDPKELKTPYDFLFRWSVPPTFTTELVGFMNERLDGKSHATRKTTEGEVVQHLSYMLALSLYPGIPVSDGAGVSNPIH